MVNNSKTHYCVVCEAVAVGIIIVGKEDSHTEIVYLITKVFIIQKRRELCYAIMWQIII